jgi:hypothetical protein
MSHVDIAKLPVLQLGRVPEEIWFEIFMPCVPNDEFVSTDIRQALLSLGHISRH